MNIALLSRGVQLYSTQSILEAARGRGHKVKIMDHLRCNLVLINRKPSILYEGEMLSDIEAVIPRIGASITHEGASVIRQFEAMGICTLTRSNALLKTRNKLRSFQNLIARNIPVPDTLLPGADSSLPPIIEMLGGFPIVVKQLESTHGVGVFLADNLYTLRAISEMFRKMNVSFVLQEFIKEAEGADIRVLVIGKKVVASMKRQAPEGEFRSNLHRGATAEPTALSPQEELIVKKAAAAMDLEVAGVDLLRSKRGPLVMEVNASPGLEGIETTTGVDVAFEMIKHLERLKRKE